jgi:hypothetical protein
MRSALPADGSGAPRSTEEEVAMKQDERIRIELTEEQKKRVKEASGRDVTTLEFSPQELEKRIAPIIIDY